jgi:uncharacterized protein (TIGR02284 family)
MNTHETLNGLLRGELAATETYQQALAKVGDDPRAAELRRIHEEHRAAANTLRQHIHHHGEKPVQGSGAWGLYAKAVEATAKFFGDGTALKALREGEEYGAREYEKALADHSLPEDCKGLIRARLLPEALAHIPVLDRMMQAKP